MKKIYFALLTVGLLAACEKSDLSFNCGNMAIHLELSETGETLGATIDGVPIKMNIVPSASGASYLGMLNGTEITLWNKGRDWTMFVNGGDSIECK